MLGRNFDGKPDILPEMVARLGRGFVPQTPCFHVCPDRLRQQISRSTPDYQTLRLLQIAMIKHAIITRLRYDDDQKLADRLEICKEFCIPSMLEQECQDFSVHIIAHEKHWNEILLAFSQFHDERIGFTENVEDCRKSLISGAYQIQTRHDSDDVMVPAYTWKIRDIYEKRIRKWDKFLINFQPTKLVAETGKQFYHHRKYSTDCISMFPTFCQREVKETVLSGEHSKLSQRLTRNVVNIPEGYVKSLIHKGNMTSHLRKSDRAYP